MSSGHVNEQMRRLITQPGDELGRLAAFVRFQAHLWRCCARRLHTNNLLAMSAALSFRTIFALVPTLVLALLAAGALGVLEDSKQSLRRFLGASGFATIAAFSDASDGASEGQELEEAASQPATQPAVSADATSLAPPRGMKVINVADEIISVVEGVQRKLTFQRIGPIGAALLIWTALSLLSTMEDSLNRVFGAARSRSTVRRVLLYWSAMTLGPVLLALAIFIGQRAIAAAQDLHVLAWLVVAAGWLGPTLVGVGVLAAAYILLPNTHVNRRAAVGGAFVALLLWLVARWGFSEYVERFVLKGNLYGILGALPLFLMWLNLSWVIFLFGAELAHAAANLRTLRLAEDEQPQILTPDDAIAVVLLAASCYEKDGPASGSQIAAAVNSSADAVAWLLMRLAERGVLCKVAAKDEPRYVLARPTSQITVAQVLDACDVRGDRDVGGAAADAGALHDGGQIPAIVQRVRARMQAELGDMTIADLLAGEDDRPPVRVVHA